MSETTMFPRTVEFEVLPGDLMDIDRSESPLEGNHPAQQPADNGGHRGPGDGDNGGGGDDDGEGDESFEPAALSMNGRFWPTPIRTQRTLQIVLGLFWILDAALQYQPYMFGKNFVPTFITGNASGQPEPLSWFITTAGHFISPDVAVWNTFFATIQLIIGGGLLFRRTVRPALAVSIVWALGIWIFGEGLGMILTGTATALTGAPGSVFIYGVLALMAWPRAKARTAPESDRDQEVTGIASSAAAQGIGGVLTPLVVWSGYWILAALLFLFPANRTQTSISSAITGMAPGSPEWYSHFLTSFGNAFSSIGTQSAWVLAIVSLIIGLGPLLAWRPGIFLLAGGFLSALMWITGQGFLGGVLSGSGTDPNTGPLVILLALSMAPTALSLELRVAFAVEDALGSPARDGFGRWGSAPV